MRVVLLGDVHFPDQSSGGPMFVTARQHYFKMLFDAYFNVEADLYIQLGDLTNVGSEEEFTSVWSLLQSYEKRFYFAYGNHDQYLADRAMIQAWTGQEPIFTLKEGDTTFLFLSTSTELEIARWGGFLDPDQLHLLEQTIHQTEGQPLVVISHHGIFDTTFRTHIPMHYLEPVEPIQAILDQRQTPALFFQAHNHVSSIETFGAWTYIQLPDTFDDPSPRLLTIDDDAYEIQAIELEDAPRIMGMGAEVIRHMVHFSPKKRDAYGTSHHRNRRIPRSGPLQ